MESVALRNDLQLAQLARVTEHRKAIVRKLKSIDASQRAIARALDVDEKTVRNDLKPPSADNSEPATPEPKQDKASETPSADNSALDDLTGEDVAKGVAAAKRQAAKDAAKAETEADDTPIDVRPGVSYETSTDTLATGRCQISDT